jgi:hypothetical protein
VRGAPSARGARGATETETVAVAGSITSSATLSEAAEVPDADQKEIR